MEANREALTALRASLKHPARASGLDYRDPTSTTRTFVQRRTAAQWLAADAMVKLHEGSLPEAKADLLALSECASLQEEDLDLVNQMVRVAIVGLGVSATWDALQAPGWTEADLAEVQRSLAVTALAIKRHQLRYGQPDAGHLRRRMHAPAEGGPA